MSRRTARHGGKTRRDLNQPMVVRLIVDSYNLAIKYLTGVRKTARKHAFNEDRHEQEDNDAQPH